MADKRKLQTEIDRCLKQVAERVEIFEETWDKVQSASNSNQKEKYEGDLKKEIKKLQRLRDQIKTWLASNDVKTQRPILTEKRRLIEVQMERFKIIERETKTKAFSKEGLALAAKIDPRERERLEVRDWLNSSVEELQMQIERYEADIESMNSGKKKKNKGPNEREEQLSERIERHQFHISKLEMLMRLLDNNTVENLDKTIKDALEEDVKYYLQENMDPDFAENEYMYDDFEDILHEATSEMGTVDATKLRHEAEEAAREKEQQEKARQAQLQKEKEQREAEKRRESSLKAEQEKVAAALAAATAAEKKKAAAKRAAPSGPEASVAKLPAQKLPGKNFAAVAGTQPPASPPVTTPAKSPKAQENHAPQTPSGSWTEPLQRSPPRAGASPIQSARSPGKENGSAPKAQNPHPDSTTEVSVSGDPGSAAEMQNLQLLLVSSMNLPEPPEKETGFKPQNPYNVPAYYPTQVPPHFLQQSFFANLETDTLFFVFYHQQGTYQQYLAARELKKQAWRFHKKYLTWFQRFEEPKIITDEFEQGTYVYFDFESGWCQRKKADFTFEYRFLEDQDLP